MIKQLSVLLTAVVLVACSRPRNIPDKELVEITHDLFLANAFRGTGSGITITDTVDMYTPIFKKYGYKPADFSYTIANFSKRKSVRFTDILDTVVARLDAEDRRLGRAIAVADTSELRLLARFGRVVYADKSMRRLTHISNPDHPDLSISIHRGQYSIDFVSDMDSSTQNDDLRFAYNTADSTGTVRGQQDVLVYGKRIRRREKISLLVTDSTKTKLQILLAQSPQTTQSSINLRIDSLKITYQPTVVAARDSLARETAYATHALFSVPHVPALPKALGPLRPHAAGPVAPRDSVVRR